MGANQSTNDQTAASTGGPGDVSEHSILVVNSTPVQDTQENRIVLPKRCLPILSLDSQKIDPERHNQRLNAELWTDFVKTLNDFVSSKADLVSAKQTKLQDRIIFVDQHVQKFTDSYVNGKHKALACMNDDCRKVEEINQLLHKCNIQSELCVNMLNKLNYILPPDQRLEPLEEGESQQSSTT